MPTHGFVHLLCPQPVPHLGRLATLCASPWLPLTSKPVHPSNPHLLFLLCVVYMLYCCVLYCCRTWASPLMSGTWTITPSCSSEWVTGRSVGEVAAARTRVQSGALCGGWQLAAAGGRGRLAVAGWQGKACACWPVCLFSVPADKQLSSPPASAAACCLLLLFAVFCCLLQGHGS